MESFSICSVCLWSWQWVTKQFLFLANKPRQFASGDECKQSNEVVGFPAQASEEVLSVRFGGRPARLQRWRWKVVFEWHLVYGDIKVCSGRSFFLALHAD